MRGGAHPGEASRAAGASQGLVALVVRGPAVPQQDRSFPMDCVHRLMCMGSYEERKGTGAGGGVYLAADILELEGNAACKKMRIILCHL